MPRQLDFYLQPTEKVAQALLGKLLVHKKGKTTLVGRIIETEAYLGLKDPACHSYHGKITPRTKTFYLPGGHAYVYLIYGMYECFNIITGDTQTPETVLIRAVEPLEGVEVMKKNRGFSKSETRLKNLCNGPGKLCQAFGITRKHNQLNLITSSSLTILNPQDPQDPKAPKDPKNAYAHYAIKGKLQIKKTPRIGIGYAGTAAHWPLRFVI